MSVTTLTERPRRPVLDPGSDLGQASARRALNRSDSGTPTLEQALDRVWEGLHAGGVAECPVCRGRMAPGAPARCRDCGSRLS